MFLSTFFTKIAKTLFCRGGGASFLLIAVSFFLNTPLHAYFIGNEQTKFNPMAEVYNNNIRGDVVIIGNTVIEPHASENKTCAFIGDASRDLTSQYAKNDPDNKTRNASFADLSIPDGAVVKKAYLFWQGMVATGYEYNSAGNYVAGSLPYVEKISIRTPTTGGKYMPLIANQNDVGWTFHRHNSTTPGKYPYAAMLDITDTGYVNGSGRYYISDLATHTGAKFYNLGAYGAWTIVVVYESPKADLRNVVIYKGFEELHRYNSPVRNFFVGKFLTPISGAVDSKFMIFVGSGDDDLKGDYIKINNKILKRDSDDDGLNAFRSSVIENGKTVKTRKPDCDNNLGIDIHIYNVGTTANMSDQRIIDNDTRNATITLGVGTTGLDVFYPSAFAFSTQLYEPRVCYYIDNITKKDGGTVIFKNGAMVPGQTISKNQEYDFNIWVSNVKKVDNEKLSSAKLVQVNMKFREPSELSYVSGYTKMQNRDTGTIGVGVALDITDAVDSDMGEYDSGNNTSTWRVGKDADGSNGGTFNPIDIGDNSGKTFISFRGKVGNTEETSLDIIDLLSFKASYETDGMPAIPKEAAIAIVQCRDMSAQADVTPGTGLFTVVNQNFVGDDKTKVQTSNRTDANALYTQISNQTFDAKLLAFNLADWIEDEKRVGYFDGDNRAYEVFAIETPKYGENCDDTCKQLKCDNAVKLNSGKSVISGNLGSGLGIMDLKDIKIAEAVKEASFQIVVDGIPTISCSIDSFAVRPAEFEFESGSSGVKLTGGALNNATLKALSNNSLPVESYNQTANNVKALNATLFIPVGCEGLEANISKDEFKFGSADFIKGKSNITTKYDNIGNISVKFTDSEWAKIDSGYGDCVVGSATNKPNVNGTVGCDVALTKDMVFVPKGFANRLAISNFANSGFTYMASDEKAMSANMHLSFNAVLDGGSIATNYHQKCYAQNITYDIGLTNDDITGWKNVTGVFATPQEQVRFYANDVISLNNAVLNSNSSIFNNGTGIANINFGFNRAANRAQNPFNVFNTDFDIASVADSDGVSGSSFTNKDDISKTTFYYGRVKASEEEYNDQLRGNLTAVINYEAYCAAGCNATDFGINASLKNRNDRVWYINEWHNGLDMGNVTEFRATNVVNQSKDSSDFIVDGVETVGYKYPKGAPLPYWESVKISASDWLMYTRSNLYVVRFLSPGGGWAGEGAVNDDNKTGRVVDTIPTAKSVRQKIDW